MRFAPFVLLVLPSTAVPGYQVLLDLVYFRRRAARRAPLLALPRVWPSVATRTVASRSAALGTPSEHVYGSRREPVGSGAFVPMRQLRQSAVPRACGGERRWNWLQMQ